MVSGINIGDRLSRPGWTNALQRLFIPYYASSQDRKVSAFFMEFFKEYFARGEGFADRNRVERMLTLAEQHIARGKGWFSGQSPETSRLECYTLAARDRVQLFNPHEPREKLLGRCRLDNAKSLADWKKRGFAEEIFWRSPDLVDFVARAHLHRFILHADYRHTIQMQPVIARIDGRVGMVWEPLLMKNGQMVPWGTLSSELSLDEDERICSIGADGKKTHWIYLEKGLTQKDRHDFSALCPFKTPAQAPAVNQVQIVTSHFPRSRWGLMHHMTKGNVHTHFRIIPRAGFSAAHPGSGLQQGGVYSIGYAARWNDVNMQQPVRMIPGRLFNPDSTEFFKEDLLVTTLDNITDAQLLSVVNVVKKHAQELRPFNIVTHNCCTETTAILKEAGVIDLNSGVRIDRALYKLCAPRILKKVVKTVGRPLAKVAPEWLCHTVSFAGFAVVMLAISPLLLLLGAGRVVPPRPGDTRKEKLSPMMSGITDLFNTSKFVVNMTQQVSKWQKKQPNTVYVEQK
jgi:hypothetical protein